MDDFRASFRAAEQGLQGVDQFQNPVVGDAVVDVVDHRIIPDADFAAETAELTRTQILQQAGISMLSQANLVPGLALSLLVS